MPIILFMYRAIVLDIQIIKPTISAMYCFKIFYTLVFSTHILKLILICVEGSKV